MSGQQEKIIWLALTELFFLDTEHQQEHYDKTASLLKEAAWSHAQTRKTLIELIAPHAGANLGYLIYPAIGEWASFDKEALCAKIQKTQEHRAQKPAWHFFLADKYCEWMMGQLKMNRLLDML